MHTRQPLIGSGHHYAWNSTPAPASDYRLLREGECLNHERGKRIRRGESPACHPAAISDFGSEPHPKATPTRAGRTADDALCRRVSLSLNRGLSRWAMHPATISVEGKLNQYQIRAATNRTFALQSTSSQSKFKRLGSRQKRRVVWTLV
jgi:hypothetical protein